MGGRRWTEQEKTFLAENWGTYSLPYIAEALGRTETAIIREVNLLQLGPFLEGGDYVTLNTIRTAFSSGVETWIRRGIPLKKRRMKRRSFWVVNLEEFWAWAEKNTDVVNFAKLPKNTLGKEPDWVDRERSRRARSTKRMEWTLDEVQRLRSLVLTGKYSVEELARELRRSYGSVYAQLKILRLGYAVKDRETKAPWTEEEDAALDAKIRQNKHNDEIDIPGRGYAAIRARLWARYGTTSARKAQANMKQTLL